MRKDNEYYGKMARVLKRQRPILDVLVLEFEDSKSYVSAETDAVLPNHQLDSYFNQLQKENPDRRVLVSVYDRKWMKDLESGLEQLDHEKQQ